MMLSRLWSRYALSVSWSTVVAAATVVASIR